MINENTECKDDQKLISPPVSTINHTVEQINNKWKQTYFKGFDKTRRDTKLKLLTTNCHSTIERVNQKFLFIIYIIMKKNYFLVNLSNISHDFSVKDNQ